MAVRHSHGRLGREWRGVVVAIAVVLGAFSTYRLWPLIHRRPDEAKVLGGSPVGPTVQPSVHEHTHPKIPVHPTIPNSEGGRLGTDSSVSTNPVALVLVATKPGRNMREGLALIGVNRARAQTYAAGSILENGARLIEVYQDHVVFARGDRRATLYLGNGGTHSPDGMGAADPMLLVGGRMVGPESPIQVPQSAVNLTDYIRAVPLYNQGVVSGVYVYPGSRPAPFAKWGLKSGDVVIALNDTPLSDADQAMQIMQALTEGAAVIATLRGEHGEQSRVTLDGLDIMNAGNAVNVATSLPRPTPP